MSNFSLFDLETKLGCLNFQVGQMNIQSILVLTERDV
jgi:hypothetical protein